MKASYQSDRLVVRFCWARACPCFNSVSVSVNFSAQDKHISNRNKNFDRQKSALMSMVTAATTPFAHVHLELACIF